ncbi:MAG: CPBP family intramembrane metalloprotease [Gammaproteobacteria bacterium]
MNSVALAANLLLIAVLVAIFVEAVRRRRETARWLPAGLACAAVIVTADVFLYVVTPAEQRLVPPAFYVIAMLVVVARTISVTAVGLAAAERIGIRPLALTASAGDRPPRRVPIVIGAGIAGGLLVALYSTGLFLVTDPDPAGGGLVAPPPPLQGGAFVLLLIALTANVLAEELTFRLGIPNYLAAIFGWSGGRYWIAVALSSALWSAGHIGILDPDWVKLGQIFPAGLLFSWLFLRFGFEASVIAHAVLNMLMPYATPAVLG